jgi:hypothetical protein
MHKKKPKAPPNDGGLNAKQILQLRSAIRKVWSWSHARKLCIKRATLPNGFAECEGCLETTAKVFADHINPCGDIDGGYIDRVFVPSDKLQALCKKCHGAKTRQERRNVAS